MNSISRLRTNIAQCTLCKAELQHGVRPVVQIHEHARILIAGQAPGIKVHESGIPFNDASGDRLREWLGLNKETFYDASKIAILPMGFCYPGTGKSGDLAPRKICAKTWREQVITAMPNIELTLVIGQYAMAYHIDEKNMSLTDIVGNWRRYPSHIIPLPHPSPRNNIWLKRNPWFTSELLPDLKTRVSQILQPSC